MEPLLNQFLSFGVTVCGGILMGICFDVYRVMRSRIKPGPVATSLGDIIYWVVVTGLVFAILLATNWGEFRFYVLVGFLMGGLAHYRFISPALLKGLSKVAHYVEKIQRGIFRRWRQFSRLGLQAYRGARHWWDGSVGRRVGRGVRSLARRRRL